MALQWRSNCSHEFPSNGHGTVVVNMERATPFSLQVKPKQQVFTEAAAPITQQQNQWLRLEVHEDAVFLKLCSDTVTKTLSKAQSSGSMAVGIEPDKVVSYWLSYDCHNMVVKYGKGYRMTDTVLLEYGFLKGLRTPRDIVEERARHDHLFNHQIPRVIELLDTVQGYTDEDNEEKQVKEGLGSDGEVGEKVFKNDKQFKQGHGSRGRGESQQQQADDSHQSMGDGHGIVLPDHQERVRCGLQAVSIKETIEFHSQPMITNFPPLVLDSSKTTLYSLDSGRYMLSSSLPSTCKDLYDNIASVSLDDPTSPYEQYKLSDAIRHSLSNPEGILYKKLKEKTSRLPKSVKEGYLRVTLGSCYGNSPGVPYVLEIWPSEYGSPVHSHGNSYAVIKVLHGGLTIFIYNKWTEDYKERSIMNFDVKEGDVTWISPNWYQTHRLWNGTEDFCATIQCYNYGHEDTVHCPHFHYVSGDGLEGDFLPNSDFTFMEMRDRVMKEYETFMDGTSY